MVIGNWAISNWQVDSIPSAWKARSYSHNSQDHDCVLINGLMIKEKQRKNCSPDIYVTPLQLHDGTDIKLSTRAYSIMNF